MSMQSDLETGLITLLKAEAGLSSVRTFEDDIRDCLFTDGKLSQGFRVGEMPALNLSATLDPTVDSPFTVGETRHDIPVSIVIVAAAQKRKDALNTVKALQEAVANVLGRLRRSNNGLASNTVLLDDKISSSAISIQDSPHCFAIGTTAMKITQITPLA